MHYEPMEYIKTIFYIKIAIILILLAYASYTFAPWLPTRDRDLKRVIDLAGLKSGETFYDLGCGTGKTVFATTIVQGVKGIGVEVFYPLFVYCRLKKFLIRDAQSKFIFGDLFKKDLSKADVVYVFGTPKTLQGKLQKKIWSEAKKGTRVISYAFEFKEMIPEKISKPSDKDLSIYLYVVS